MSLSTLIDNFFDGFGPGSVFFQASRAGAPTQVFATDDVPFSMPLPNAEIEKMVADFESADRNVTQVARVRNAV